MVDKKSDKMSTNDKFAIAAGSLLLAGDMALGGVHIAGYTDSQLKEFEASLDKQASSHVQQLKDSGKQLTEENSQREYYRKWSEEFGKRREEADKVYADHESRKQKGFENGAKAGAVLPVAAAVILERQRRKEKAAAAQSRGAEIG